MSLAWYQTRDIVLLKAYLGHLGDYSLGVKKRKDRAKTERFPDYRWVVLMSVLSEVVCKISRRGPRTEL